MLSTESRMRGDMQVRFGGRYGKTYCRKAVRRSVPSLRAGKGGNIIALARELYAVRQPTLPLETDSGADTQRAPGLLLFWRATTL